jgi:hypothetical protein
LAVFLTVYREIRFLKTSIRAGCGDLFDSWYWSHVLFRVIPAACTPKKTYGGGRGKRGSLQYVDHVPPTGYGRAAGGFWPSGRRYPMPLKRDACGAGRQEACCHCHVGVIDNKRGLLL